MIFFFHVLHSLHFHKRNKFLGTKKLATWSLSLVRLANHRTYPLSIVIFTELSMNCHRSCVFQFYWMIPSFLSKSQTTKSFIPPQTKTTSLSAKGCEKTLNSNSTYSYFTLLSFTLFQREVRYTTLYGSYNRETNTLY